MGSKRVDRMLQCVVHACQPDMLFLVPQNLLCQGLNLCGTCDRRDIRSGCDGTQSGISSR